MKLRALVIDGESREAIARLVHYADANRIGRRRLTQTVEMNAPPVGDNPAFSVVVPYGYRCVFSIEDQPAGWCRHLSVSVVDPEPERPLPSVESVEALMVQFGFEGSIKRRTLKGTIWTEEKRAVNVVEIM